MSDVQQQQQIQDEYDDDITHHLDQDPESSDIDIKALSVGAQIGAGSYGMVYKGTYFGSVVAIKKINPGPHQREILKYLKREISVLKNIHHPNIVQFIGVYYEYRESSLPLHLQSNSTWIVTEFITGGNLHERIKDMQRPFPLSIRFKLALDIALAMAYLHSRDILFRDLKPKNILIDDRSSHIIAKVCDFGFARVKPKSRHLSICGTDSFLAPEVILGMDYDETADIFSFGVLLLELATRRKISKEIERAPNNAFEIQEDTTRSLIPEDMPPLFTELIVECLRYQPEERPTFPHIIHTLKQLVSLFPLPPQLDNPLSPQSSPLISRKNSASATTASTHLVATPQQQLNKNNRNINNSNNNNSGSDGDDEGSSQLLPFDRVMYQSSIIDKQSLISDPLNNGSSHNDDSYSSTSSSSSSSSSTSSSTNCNNNESTENVKLSNQQDNNNNNINSNNDNVSLTLSATLATVEVEGRGGEEELDMDEEEIQKKLEHLIERMLAVLVELDNYIKPMTKVLMSITDEEQITDRYDECRKVIEIKKVLGEVVEDDILPPLTPRKSSVSQQVNRVTIFLKSMDRSLQEIAAGISFLIKRIERLDNLSDAVLFARAISKVKKIIYNN